MILSSRDARTNFGSAASGTDREGRPPVDPLERLLRKVRREQGGCWVWRGALNAFGVGQFRLDRFRVVPAHRAACELFNGPIPKGYVVHRLCGDPACVAPAHLVPVPRRDLPRLKRGEDLGRPQPGHANACTKLRTEPAWPRRTRRSVQRLRRLRGLGHRGAAP